MPPNTSTSRLQLPCKPTLSASARLSGMPNSPSTSMLRNWCGPMFPGVIGSTNARFSATTSIADTSRFSGIPNAASASDMPTTSSVHTASVYSTTSPPATRSPRSCSPEAN